MPGVSDIQIDGSVVRLRFSEEATPCVLSSNPIWYETEPNTFPNDFGGEVVNVARNPINEGRQRFKSIPVDRNSAAGYNQDLTQTNAQRVLRGMFYANYRERADTRGFTRGDASTNITITNVDSVGDSYDAASGLGVFATGDIILGSNFTNAANNGRKRVTSVSATGVGVAEPLINEAAPPATARINKVGFRFGTSEVDVDITGSLPRLVRASGTKDFTDFALLPGESIYIGGDAANTSFTNAVNNGPKRVLSVSATEIVIDKSESDMVAETAGGLTIEIFLPTRSIKDEAVVTDQIRRTLQFERTLGSSTGNTNVQAQYEVGSNPNVATINLDTASLATMDFGWIGLLSETLNENNLPTNFPRTTPAVAADAIKSESSNLGSTIVAVDETDAFNTSSDLSFIRVSKVTAGDEAPPALVGLLQNLTLGINNQGTANKALGVFGSTGVSRGNFEVSATMTGYFSDVASIDAVNNGDDITLSFWQIKNNAGIVFDVPLATASDGRPEVVLNQLVTIPLTLQAARGNSVNSALTHTLMMSVFDYLPDAAEIA